MREVHRSMTCFIQERVQILFGHTTHLLTLYSRRRGESFTGVSCRNNPEPELRLDIIDNAAHSNTGMCQYQSRNSGKEDANSSQDAVSIFDVLFLTSDV